MLPGLDSSRALAWLAVAAVVLIAALYALAFGTGAGRWLDELLLPDRFHSYARLLHATYRGSQIMCMLIGAGLLMVAFMLGRLESALAAAVVVAGSNLTTALLKPVLARADLLGSEGERTLGGGYFPSGNATLAASVALATLIIVPRPWLRVVWPIALAYALIVGAGLVAFGGHYLSDVMSGWLVAVAWAAAVMNALRWRQSSSIRGRP